MVPQELQELQLRPDSNRDFNVSDRVVDECGYIHRNRFNVQDLA